MKTTALLILGFLAITMKGQGVSGMDVDSGLFYYAFKDKIRCHSLALDKTTLEKDLAKDEKIMEVLYIKCMSLYKIAGDTVACREAREGIHKLKMVNITCYNRKVYAGVRFQTEAAENSPVRFAILELDRQLQLKDYYIFCVTSTVCRFFTLPPYHPVEFIDQQTIGLPLMQGGKFDYCALILNKQHEIRLKEVLFKDIELNNKASLESGNNVVLEPNIYSIKENKRRLFYQFPFPLFRDQQLAGFIDVLNRKSFMDSFSNAPDFKGFVLNWRTLDFRQASSRYSHVIMAADIVHDTLYFVSISKDPGKIDLVWYDLKTGSNKINTMDISYQDHHILIRDEKLYVLSFNEGISKVTLHDTRSFFGMDK